MRLSLALAGLALLPFVVRAALAVAWMLGDPPAIHVDGDDALIELAAIEALAGERSLGAYSRFGWFHPGPLYFYLLAPLYELSGRHAMGVHWGALLLNGLAALGLLLGTRLSPWTSAALALHVAAFGALRISHPWNPFVTVLPFALFVWACSARRPLLLAPLGTFLVQAHVGYALVVAMLGAVGLAGPVRSRSRVAALGAALAVALLLWLPPLLAAPANFAHLARFFVEPTEGHSLAESASLVGSMFGAAGAYALGLFQHPELPWIGLLVAVAELAFVAYAWRRGDRLAGLVLLSAAVAVLSATRVRGELHWYLLLWASALGMLGWAAVGAALLPGRRWGPSAASAAEEAARRGRQGAPAGSTTLAVLVALGATIASLQQIAAAPFPEPTDASRRIAALAAAAPPGRLLLRVDDEDAWRPAAGLVLALVKAGREVAVEGYGAEAFGPRFVPRGDETPFRLAW